MVSSIQTLKVATLFYVLCLAGCVFAPTPPDPQARQAALERWNRCLKRFELKPELQCEGHLRDVLATYPEHMENHISALLSQQQHNMRSSKLMKTGRIKALAVDEKAVQDTLLDTRDEAR